MNRYILTIALVILSACATFAQQANTKTSATSSTTATAKGKAINLESGTSLAAQLQNSLDVRKAKVGDQVVLKTTEAIKSQGHTVINKGARLIGHVTSVGQKTSANGASSLSLVFDRLESGSLNVPINATITSIARAATRTNASDEGLSSDTAAQSTSSARTSSRQSSGNGGLLGGVPGTVGGVVNPTTQTAGNVVGGTTTAVGNVTENVGGIRISESSDTSVEGGSTLSLTGNNLHLEKGTTFNLRLRQSASAGRDNQ